MIEFCDVCMNPFNSCDEKSTFKGAIYEYFTEKDNDFIMKKHPNRDIGEGAFNICEKCAKGMINRFEINHYNNCGRKKFLKNYPEEENKIYERLKKEV